MALPSSKVEVQVIDDKLLMDSILSEATKVTGEFSLVEAAPSVLQISLSFKRIGSIENLVGFDSLVKLCLDNNLIEEIANLGHLRKLQWLDLSFNKIRKIQGLETLSHLKDLTLFSNEISVVEGLDSCTNLECLSIGNNLIKSTDNIIKLRSIKSLKMLTVSGNEVCKVPEYKTIVLAYVDTLKYLDYALIDEAERSGAKELYHEEVREQELNESVNEEKATSERAAEAYAAKLDTAGILFAHSIFDDMFVEDSDVERLRHMPGVKEYVDQFRTNFKVLSDEYIKTSLEKFEKKKAEISEFDAAVQQVRVTDDTESTRLIEGFQSAKKAVANVLTDSKAVHTHQDRQRMVKTLQDELERVCDELMSIEMRQVQKFEGLVYVFDNRLIDFKVQAQESQETFFRAMEGLEDTFSQGIKSVAQDLIDKLGREELPEDYLDYEAMSLVIDKDSCMTVISNSHDFHVGRILKRLADASSTETKRYQEMIAHYNSTERMRNRDRIVQIHEFSRSCKISLNALLQNDDDDDMVGGGEMDA